MITCADCGKQFEPARWQRKPGVLRFCSPSCKTAHQNRKPMPARFWAMVQKDEPHKCWIWTGAKNAFGYGQTRYVTASGKAEQKAHRVSWILANGEIPQGRL